MKLRSAEKVARTWGHPETLDDVNRVFLDYISGKFAVLPWVDTEMSTEAALIQEELLDLN